MITIALSQPKVILGGTPEERELYGKAFAKHYGRVVEWAEPLQGVRYHITFAEALAEVNQAAALAAEAMYQGADSCWDFTVNES